MRKTSSGKTIISTTDRSSESFLDQKKKNLSEDPNHREISESVPEDSWWRSNALVVTTKCPSGNNVFGNPESLWDGCRE